MGRLLLLLFLSLITAFGAGAQSILRLQHFNVDDGLSQSSVYHIIQDRQGFIWLATGDGLNKFDGKIFTTYKSHFTDSFSAQMKDRNINSAIFEDREKKLWFSTDGGVAYLNTRNGTSKLVLNVNLTQNAAKLVGIDDSLVWAAVPRYGIYSVNITSLQYHFYPYNDSLQNNLVSIYPFFGRVNTPAGIYLSDRAGLLYFDKRTKTDKRVLAVDNILNTCLLRNGKIVLTSVNGIYLFDTNKKIASFISLSDGRPDIPLRWRSAVEDTKTNSLYLSADNQGAICKMDLASGKYEFLNFQSKPIEYLFLDRSQNLWIGTEGDGFFIMDVKQPKFFCYPQRQDNDENDADNLMVKSIFRDDSGKIWLGTYNNGLRIYDPRAKQEKQVTLPCPTDARSVTSIFKDSSGLIVATIGATILWLDPNTLHVRRQTSLPMYSNLSAEEPIIYSLIEWKRGHYLAGTNLSLFSVTYEKEKASYSRPFIFKTNMHISSHAYNLTQNADGTINVGKRSGFATIRMLGDTVLEVPDEGFEHIPIRHFYQSTTPPITWMASEIGLIAYNRQTKRFRIFDESAGMANSFVYAILPQNDSSLWLSTNKGISFARVKYGNGNDVSARFINYTSKDGLQSNEFNTGAYFHGNDGTMYFGGIAGVNWFRPDKIEINPYKAAPAITNIYINDTLFAGDSANDVRTLVLPYQNNTIGFSLRALEYTMPEQNLFAYKLEGLDKDWVVTNNDKVRYSHLPPGSYTFLLKASNNEGVWNDEPFFMQIIIQPPYWQTWWFRSGAFLLIVAAIYFISRSIVRQKIKARTRELEKQQALYLERLRISKDVHDDLGSGLSKISLMAEIARNRTKGDETLNNDIEHISSVSKELVDNMHDLIWVLNPENTTLEQLVSRMREYCYDYLDNMPIEVAMDFPDEVPQMKISREAQRNLFLTTKEAINNCIKHANATRIGISLKIDSEKMAITVTDNGKGFEMAKLKGSGNGLRNMKQRIELIGGRFLITSVPNNTTVAISIPLHQLAA